MEEKREGEYLPIEENDRGTFIFNSKDLCMIEHVPELIEAGIDSFKIEGRMKAALYVATVTRTYRRAIDDYNKGIEVYKANMPWYKEQITASTYRPYCTGFYFGKPDTDSQLYGANTYERGYIYLGYGEEKDGDWLLLTQKNKFSVGEDIEIMKPNGDNIPVKVLSITDEDGNEMESAPHASQKIRIRLSGEAEIMDILRKKDSQV